MGFLWNILIYLVLVSIPLVNSQCTANSIQRHTDGLHFSRSYELSVNGYTEKSTQGELSQKRFSIGIRAVNSSNGIQFIRGSIHILPDTRPHVIKDWDTRSYQVQDKEFKRFRGDIEGVFNPYTNILCAKACIYHTWDKPVYPAFQHNSECDDAVLSLKYPQVRTIDNCMVKGELKSLLDTSSSKYFKPISLQGYSRKASYNYTKLSEAEEVCLANLNNTNGVTYTSNASICEVRYVNMKIEPGMNCSRQACRPFGSKGTSLSLVKECHGSRVNGILSLKDHSGFSRFVGNDSLAVEGVWNTRQLCMAACQIIRDDDSPVDCSIQITLEFPLEFSIHWRSTVVGNIRSRRPTSDPLYFEPLQFSANAAHASIYELLPNSYYTYTKVELAKEQCSSSSSGKNENDIPSISYADLTFFGNVLDKTKMPASAVPLHVPNQFDNTLPSEGLLKKARNVSFEVTVGTDHIPAEGQYDPSSGTVCLIGCKKVNNQSIQRLEHGKDCKVFIKIEYPSKMSGKRQIVATISSLREKNDILFFKPMRIVSQRGMYVSEARDSVFVADVELILSVLTLTIVLVSVCFQIAHSRKRQQKCQYVSLVMLLVLLVGHMAPLILNFDAIFHNTTHHYVRGAIRHEEVIVRLMNMAAFLLLLWQLHLVWSSRKINGDDKAEPHEKYILAICLPLYILGALTTSLIVKGRVWTGLKAYGGLTLDFFLVPQIIAYTIWNVKVPALSKVFYIGMTVARVLPHGFDVYRRIRGPLFWIDKYYYANPEWDFFSLAADIGIPCGALLAMVSVFLQQRYGGRWFLPHRFTGVYQRVEQTEQQ